MRKDEFPLIEAYADSKVNEVLDKIRAEIKELPTYDPIFVETYTAYGMKQDVLKILDKYKAETEGKNA